MFEAQKLLLRPSWREITRQSDNKYKLDARNSKYNGDTRTNEYGIEVKRCCHHKPENRIQVNNKTMDYIYMTMRIDNRIGTSIG